MTLKYESEILFDLMKRDGDDAPSDVLPYESELKEKYLQQVEGAYPKLMDYRPEWLNYNLHCHLPADFPVETLCDVTNATVDNVVPYAYGSAILKGNTDENLQSVKMPVLKTIGENIIGECINPTEKNKQYNAYLKPNTTYTLSYKNTDGSSTGSGKVYLKNGDTEIANYGYKHQMNFTTPSTTNSETILCINPRGDGDISVLLIEGEVSYSNLNIETILKKPYKSNILTVNEDVTLRGVGDVQDELDCLTGEVTERIGEVVLDGSQTLQPHSIVQGDTLMIKISDASISFKQNSNAQESWDFSDMICDKELIAETPKWNANEWNEGYNIALISSALSDTYNINSFVLAIRRSYFNVQSIDEFKTWLTQNPLTIQYKLAEESIKTVDLTVTDQDGNNESIIRPIEGTMHLMTEGESIKPLFSGEIPVESTTQNLASFIKE